MLSTLRAEMARKRVTQDDLAQAIGLSQPAIGRRMSGQVDWGLSELQVVADLLGMPLAALVAEPVTGPIAVGA